MAKKDKVEIRGLTSNYVRDVETRIRAYELVLINESYDFDVETKISNDIRALETHVGKLSREQLACFDYWKYKFYMAQGKEREAFSALKRSKESGNADALAQCAYYYSTGTGIALLKNKFKAKKYFEQAFASCDNSMFVEYLYAEAMLCNKSDDTTKKNAIEYYKQSIKKGVLEARYKLACIYIDMKQNLIEAEKLLRECNDPNKEEKINEIKRIQYSRK